MTIPKKLTLSITKVDIAGAICGNRQHCIIANALNRQERLGGHGYVRVDANDVGFTKGGIRRHYQPPRAALIYLRRFDQIGERDGEEAARSAMDERDFKLSLVRTRAVTPPATPARKAQINRRRNRIAAEERAKGIHRKPPEKRYAGL